MKKSTGFFAVGWGKALPLDDFLPNHAFTRKIECNFMFFQDYTLCEVVEA